MITKEYTVAFEEQDRQRFVAIFTKAHAVINNYQDLDNEVGVIQAVLIHATEAAHNALCNDLCTLGVIVIGRIVIKTISETKLLEMM